MSKTKSRKELDPLDRMRQTFDDDAARFEVEDARTKDDITAACSYWVGYPMWLEAIRGHAGHDWRADNRRRDAYHALNFVHLQATHVLMCEAEKHGLDPSPLHECGRVVREIYAADPAKYYTGRNDGWPDCMGAARYALPTGQQEALRDGAAVFVRLAIKPDLDGAREPEGKLPAARRGRGRKKLSPREDKRRMKIIERWDQAKEDGVSKDDFCKDENITPRFLQTCLDWLRQRETRA